MRVVEHYRREVQTIPVGATVTEVAEQMRAEELGSLVVMDGKKPVGIVTDRDLLCRVVAVGRDPAETSAGDVMSQPMATVEPTDSLERVVEAMGERGVRRVPVVHREKLKGIVALDDTFAALSDELADLTEGMRRSARAAAGRRIAHEVEGWISEVNDQLERLGEDLTRGFERRLDSVLGRIGLQRAAGGEEAAEAGEKRE